MECYFLNDTLNIDAKYTDEPNNPAFVEGGIGVVSTKEFVKFLGWQPMLCTEYTSHAHVNQPSY